MDFEPDAVPGAVGHGGVGVRVSIFGGSNGVTMVLDDFDCRFVNIFAGGTWFGGALGCSFGLGDGFVHLGELIGDVAVADGAGAIAVVAGVADVGEEVDDDGFLSVEDSCASVVAISADGSAGDD